MKTLALTHLCLSAALCTLLTQCATSPRPASDPQITHTAASREQMTETTVHFAGKTFLRREVKMIDGTGDTRVTMTEL